MTSDPAEMRRMWKIFKVGKNHPISLRAIWPKGSGFPKPVITKTYRADDYPDINDRQEAFIADAVDLNNDGYNVYIPINSINPTFRAGPISDGDIYCRDLLMIDIDRARDTKSPATNAELQSALDLGGRVEQFLMQLGFDAPCKVMSGNGLHLYYRLDGLPNDQTSKTMIGDFLKALAFQFDTDDVHVDTAVVNASRITKVPGTIARKGDESANRPYRMAKVL
jgi:hypothetical protein